MALWLKLGLAALTLAGGIFTWYTGPARRRAKQAKKLERMRREIEKAAAEGDDDTVARLYSELNDML